MDTPGLADTKLRKAAGEAIYSALTASPRANFKIFFVITLEVDLWHFAVDSITSPPAPLKQAANSNFD